ncbi:hypothetical protein ACLB9X_10870 [Streptomyces sp. 5K101]|uniref:hypothetical protein n=1 Tax=Streptomyces sp. 5K101 TaxID=3390037 RepID=UPI003974E6B4
MRLLVDEHYTAEAQTLTSEAEAHLLKLAQIRGNLTAAQATRWTEITAAYTRSRTFGDSGHDPLRRAVAALGLLADRIRAVEAAITRVTDRRHLPARPNGRHASRPGDEQPAKH